MRPWVKHKLNLKPVGFVKTQTYAALKVLLESPGFKFTVLEVSDSINGTPKNVSAYMRNLHLQGIVKSDRRGTRGRRANHFWVEP